MNRDEIKQPETIYGDPISQVHVVCPDLGWQGICTWSELYKCYVSEPAMRADWDAEKAPKWTR